eukprot:996280-Pyramimonas_sp.AAC.1
MNERTCAFYKPTNSASLRKRRVRNRLEIRQDASDTHFSTASFIISLVSKLTPKILNCHQQGGCAIRYVSFLCGHRNAPISTTPFMKGALAPPDECEGGFARHL